MSRKVPKNLAEKEFVLSIIRNMRTALVTPGYVLNMRNYAQTYKGECHVCIGGSAVVFGLGGSNYSGNWTKEQWIVAEWCNLVRIGSFSNCSLLGHPIPSLAQQAWSKEMMNPDSPDFFPAWERFANALPSKKDLTNHE